MNINSQSERVLRNLTARTLRHAATLAFLIAASGTWAAAPDPLLPAGEQALIGSYKLDNVLLAARKLVLLPNAQPMFQALGETLDQASQEGLLNGKQVEVLRNHVCTLTFAADHTFNFTNVPSGDLNTTMQVAGTWSMQVYHVFDTYGYRISLKCDGYKIHASFMNGDKPSPRILTVFYQDGKRNPALFRFNGEH